MRGQVSWFHRSFGFIIQKDGGPDLFVHHENIIGEGYRTLAGGDKVEYEIGRRPGSGKPIAINVRKLEDKHGAGVDSVQGK